MEKVRHFTDFVLSSLDSEFDKNDLVQAQKIFSDEYVKKQMECIKKIRSILDVFCRIDSRIRRRDLIAEFYEISALLQSRFDYLLNKDVPVWPAHYYDLYTYLKANEKNWEKVFNFAEIQDIISLFLNAQLFFKYSYQLEQLQKWINCLNRTQFKYF